MGYKSALADRRVLVTGANGFIGSHLVDRLVEHGSDVVAFVRATPNNQYRNLAQVRDDIDIIRGDLQDPASVRKAARHLAGYGDALVFHLGAQAHVGESWERPHETVSTNIIGTLNLLQAIHSEDIDIAKFNTAGTSEQYGNQNQRKSDSYRKENGTVTLDERAPLNPTSVYATSKVAADFLTRNYHDAYGLPTITTRMFNNYGPRQNPCYITGTVITQALKRDVVELGNLAPKRDMCFVSDGVRGHLDTTLHGNPGEVYTYGYGENISMRKWTKKILRIGRENGFWDDADIVQSEDRFRPGTSDVQELQAGYEKLHDLTGWEPTVGWDEGIRRTIAWYADHEEQWRGLCDWAYNNAGGGA